MKRLVVTLIALGVVVLAALAPALAWNSGSSGDTYEPTSISSYLADFTVEADGDLRVVETITVEFGSFSDRHGIFRFWDRADPNAPRLRRDPQDIQIQRNGSDEDYELLTEEHGRYTVARIGSEFITVSDSQTYRIAYRIEDALLPTDDGSRFYWNLIPGGWAQDISNARLTVHLPAEAGAVQCAVGVAATDGCQARGEGTDTLTVNVSDLPSRTPVTVSTMLPIEVPAASNQRLWSARWDPIFGTSLPALLGTIAVAVVAAGSALRVVQTAQESNPAYPLIYAPPAGIGPAQGQYILTERVQKTAFIASLMEAAEKGAVDLRRGEGEWQIDGKPAPVALDHVTSFTTDLLGVTGSGSFTAARKDVEAGKALLAAKKKADSSVPSWAQREGFMTPSGLGGAGGFMVIICAIAAVLLIVFNPMNFSFLALVPGAFAACGLWLLVPGSGTKRTAKGRELWSQVGGFYRVLSTPSSQLRFDFSGRKELYTAYLPWAVAFGVADAWAKKYRVEMGEEPPMPAYFASNYNGSHTGNHVDQMVNDFQGTVNSAISSYQATQRSSSSGGGGGGGGGFSGGGGGGGGGGGSW